ncbi:DNA replication protein [Sorochytrium milnesiophthora]
MADYYDVDDILAEQQKLPAVFTTTVPAMGYLEGSTQGDDDIQRGTKMELPLWLVEQLTLQEFVDLSVPRQLSPSVRSAIRASAAHLDLFSLYPYFYRFCERYLSIAHDAELQGLLLKCFKDRLSMLLDHTQTKASDYTSELLRSLDWLERDVLRQGQESAGQVRNWSMRQSSKLKKSLSLSMIEPEASMPKRRSGSMG